MYYRSIERLTSLLSTSLNLLGFATSNRGEKVPLLVSSVNSGDIKFVLTVPLNIVLSAISIESRLGSELWFSVTNILAYAVAIFGGLLSDYENLFKPSF